MAAAYGRTRAGVVRSILRTPGMRREEREIYALAEEKLAFFGQRLMGYRWNQPAYSLSYANRRRLEIARATATGRAHASARRARRRDEPEGDARDHGADRAAAHGGRLHDPRDRARHARRRGHLRPRRRARPRRSRSRRARSRRSRPTRASSRRTSARRRRRRSERRRAAAPARGRRHLLRPDPHPPGGEPRRRRGRARLPARRQRVGQVDDAEDDPRDRLAAERGRCASAGEEITRRPTAHRIAPRARDRAREPPRLRADVGAREPRDGRLPAAEGGPEGGVRAGLRPLPAPLRAARSSSPGRSRAASSRCSRWDAR